MSYCISHFHGVSQSLCQDETTINTFPGIIIIIIVIVIAVAKGPIVMLSSRLHHKHNGLFAYFI